MDSATGGVVQDNAIGRSSWIEAANKVRRFSRYFGWPILVMFLLSPWSLHFGASGTVFYLLVGLPAGLCGLALRMWSLGYRRDEGFVLDGPYRYVRNPVELGTLLVYAGAAVSMGLPWWYNVLCLVASMLYMSFVAISYEFEHYQMSGAAYLRYRQRVRRWIPGSLPGANRSNRTYVFMLAVKNESKSLLWLFAYGVVFAVRKHYMKF